MHWRQHRHQGGQMQLPWARRRLGLLCLQLDLRARGAAEEVTKAGMSPGHLFEIGRDRVSPGIEAYAKCPSMGTWMQVSLLE
eukprot:9299721-Karenia_brevis.AAC.1